MNSKRYVLYVRASGDPKKREQTEREQLSLLKEFAELQKIEVIASLVDYGYAKSKNRPAFTSVLHLLRKGEASGILCVDIDRLCRDIDTASMLVRLIYQSGIEILTPDFIFKKGVNETQRIVGFGLLCEYYNELNQKLTIAKKLRRTIN